MTIVLCTACSAEYNLTLNDNSFNEELNAMNIDSSSYYNELSVQRFPFKSQYGTLIDAVAPVVSDKFPESNKKIYLRIMKIIYNIFMNLILEIMAIQILLILVMNSFQLMLKKMRFLF